MALRVNGYHINMNYSTEPISKRPLLYNFSACPVECEAYSSGVMWYIPHGGAQILILKIFYIFTPRALTSWRLRLKFSPSLTLYKIERFETSSLVINIILRFINALLYLLIRVLPPKSLLFRSPVSI